MKKDLADNFNSQGQQMGDALETIENELYILLPWSQ